MAFFVNLPISWIVRDVSWIDWFIKEGINPELGLDAPALEKPLAWHRHLAGHIRQSGLSCSVHLPFMGLSPGDADKTLCARSANVLAHAADLAKIYGARHMIGHPNFWAAAHGSKGDKNIPDPAWIDRSVKVWRVLPERAQAPLYLENIQEQSPVSLPALLAAIGMPQAGICFDVGHWHSFSNGRANSDMPRWIEAFAPYLRHLHLHDNDGSNDGHLGLGQGAIDYGILLDSLSRHALKPTMTFEPHTAGAFMQTIVWFDAHPGAARQLGWVRPLLSGGDPPKELL